MNRTTNEATVTPEEVERRIAEYRQISFERQLPAQVVYHPPEHPCPWPGCNLRIAGVHFQLENVEDEALRKRWLTAWWKGPGLVGRCPGCGRYVLFGLTSKQAVSDLHSLEAALLPDDWQQRAYIVVRPEMLEG
jgi:hypothetical protein